MSGQERLKVLLMDPDPEFSERASVALASDPNLDIVGLPTDEGSLRTSLASTKAHVVVLDVAGVRSDPAELVHAMLADAPETAIVVTGTSASADALSKTISAGARGFLLKPCQPAQLVERIHEALRGARSHARDAEARPRAGRGQVIAVYGPKGGVGCTTVATNLAVALAERKARTAIVDLDLQFGDVGVVLDLKSANSIVELTQVASIDSGVVEDVFVRHTSGVRALLAPDNLAGMESVNPERIARAIEQLRDHFDYVVCDLWSSLDELTTSVLTCADRIILLATPELPALRDLQRALVAIAPLHLDTKAQVVLNRYPASAGFSRSDVERALARPVAATIPSEGVAVTQSINEGRPLMGSRTAKGVKSYRALAESIAHDAAGSPKTASAPRRSPILQAR